jgi:hypothetical protein
VDAGAARVAGDSLAYATRSVADGGDMTRKLLLSFFAAVLLVSAAAFADDQQDLLAANKALMQAAAASDGDTAEKWLDAAFTATDSYGHTESRAEALQDNQTFTDIPNGNPQMRLYGNVGVITTENGKRHVMMIWAKRPEGWRALVYHEVKQVETVPPSAGGGSNDCTNPCKTVPYKPKNADEQGVITSWQQLETAVTGHNSAEWARHVADEFVVISSGSDKPVFKADRMAVLDRQKQTNAPSAPVPLVSAEMIDFPNTIVMLCNHRRSEGKPTRVTRVWVKRGGMWQMAYSFQTTVQQAEQSSAK